VYLSFDIYKITMTSSPTFYCTNEKNCEKNCLLIIDDTDTVTSRLFRESFNCRYNPRMDYAFCLLTWKSSEKWRSPLFGATCNFNGQILPYATVYYVYCHLHFHANVSRPWRFPLIKHKNAILPNHRSR
jgi:hypothetical protein